MDKLAELVGSSDMVSLARKTGISPVRLHAIREGGDASLSELRLIASALRLELDDLVPPADAGRGAALLFRNAAPTTANVAMRLSRKIAYSADILADQGEPAPWLAEFDITRHDFAEAEQAATKFREMFADNNQVGPFFDLPELLGARLGVVLLVINTSEIDGASAYFRGLPFIFVSARFPPRMLFTVGHELGHLVAHRDRGADFALLDASTEDLASRVSRTVQERFAHAFASCLLMPRSGVGIALKQIRSLSTVHPDRVGDIELLYLSRIFGVSFEAAARRCEDLQLLPRGGAASLNAELKERFGSAEKRAEAIDLPPRPKIRIPTLPRHLLDSAIARINAGQLSIGKASAILGVSISEIVSSNAPSTH
jgi:Zn-dependent peptidase ImmA (M78 family)